MQALPLFFSFFNLKSLRFHFINLHDLRLLNSNDPIIIKPISFPESLFFMSLGKQEQRLVVPIISLASYAHLQAKPLPFIQQ